MERFCPRLEKLIASTPGADSSGSRSFMILQIFTERGCMADSAPMCTLCEIQGFGALFLVAAENSPQASRAKQDKDFGGQQSNKSKSTCPSPIC